MVFLHCPSFEELDAMVDRWGRSLAASGHEKRSAAAGHRRRARYAAGTLCRFHTLCGWKAVMEGESPRGAPKSGE